jgi:hypothetical protein
MFLKMTFNQFLNFSIEIFNYTIIIVLKCWLTFVKARAAPTFLTRVGAAPRKNGAAPQNYARN